MGVSQFWTGAGEATTRKTEIHPTTTSLLENFIYSEECETFYLNNKDQGSDENSDHLQSATRHKPQSIG
jgi:hypothetical protein